MHAIKLLLVEDSSVLAERIAELVRGIPEIDLIAVVDSESAALLEMKKRRVHMVVLDLHLKQGTGFGILRAMNNIQPKPRVIVHTNHYSADYENNALLLGADIFLDKARDFERLPEILKTIVKPDDMR
jgi:DNA-binding NarL/FixJ family response regulator